MPANKKRAIKPAPSDAFDLEDYVRRSTEASGVSEKVEDPVTIAKVASLLHSARYFLEEPRDKPTG